jgi:hypothetical protein
MGLLLLSNKAQPRSSVHDLDNGCIRGIGIQLSGEFDYYCVLIDAQARVATYSEVVVFGEPGLSHSSINFFL